MVKINVFDSSEVIIDDYPFAEQLKEVLVPVLAKYPDIQKRRSNVKARMTEWKWDPDLIPLRNFKNYIQKIKLQLLYILKPPVIPSKIILTDKFSLKIE